MSDDQKLLAMLRSTAAKIALARTSHGPLDPEVDGVLGDIESDLRFAVELLEDGED